MVIAGGDVGDERPEHIERRAWQMRFSICIFAAISFIAIWPGPSIMTERPCPTHASQVSELDQLTDLTGVGRIVDAAGTERVTERDRDVITAQDVQNVVVILEKRVFIARHLHPREQQRATARDDVHFASLTHEGLDRASVDACVNGHESTPSCACASTTRRKSFAVISSRSFSR